MAAAEKRLKKELETKPCSELDIENVNDDEPYIEMVWTSLFSTCNLFISDWIGKEDGKNILRLKQDSHPCYNMKIP